MAELSIPSTMRAWTYRKRGPVSDVLKLDSAIPTPLLRASSDILVKVSHSALTPGASLTWLFPNLPFLARPYIPELDFSGVIAAAGPAVPGSLKPGTAVFGSILLPAYLLSGSGSMAEYVVVSANCVSPLPEAEGFGLAEAAGLNGNGQTAVLMLKNGRVGQGSKVFVNGGSSGVGTLLIQIAKAQGAYVVATGSVQSANMVKSLGADEVIDYRAHTPLHAYLSDKHSSKPFDSVLDTIGIHDLYVNCPAYLKQDGVFVNIGAMEGLVSTLWAAAKYSLWPRILGGTPRTYIFQQTNPDQQTMQYLSKLVEEKKLSVVVDQVFEMENALDAYERLLSQRAKGKVVVKIQKN